MIRGYDFLLKLFVFQQHDVAFEDSFLLFAEGFASFGLDRFQLFGRFRAAGQKTRDFLLYLISRDFSG